MVATVIRDDIDYLDLSLATASAEDQVQTTRKIIGTTHVSLGSPCMPIAFSNLEDEHSADTAFKDFRKKIARFFTRFLGKSVRFGPGDQVRYSFGGWFCFFLQSFSIDKSLSTAESQL